jgi:hypothetical protein
VAHFVVILRGIRNGIASTLDIFISISSFHHLASGNPHDLFLVGEK